MAEPGNYIFLPWVRQGAAAGIDTTDMTANQPAVVSVSVQLGINNAPPDVQRQVRLYGPGDVVGIDPLQVVRTEPRAFATDFEPNYFPAIEFDRPDFLWLFTPAKADDQGKLRPWLCLVVIKKQQGVAISLDRNLPLPVLEIKSPARADHELPNLSEAWAWAHAQVAGAQPQFAALKSPLGGDPALNVSRLLCPRRLDPLTDYIACVVPTFEQGRRAGLGQPVQMPNEQPPLGLTPAWLSGDGSPAEVRLPVYFQWEFRTGTGGDFESLVGQLKAREIPATVGKRPIDLSEPGFVLQPPLAPNAPGTMLGLEGALRVVGSKPDDWPAAIRQPFQTALQGILSRAWEVATKEDDNHDPIVGPPVYGCWQAGRHIVNTTTPPPLNWLDELNLDPRHRVTAAFGTQVIQAEQEDLMASAWEQLGEIQRVNQIRRQGQLGRSVSAVYHARHFSQFSEDTLLKVLAPAQTRLVIEATSATDKRTFLAQKISQSPIPSAAVSAPLRRLTGSRSIVNARFAMPAAAPTTVVARLATFAVTAALPLAHVGSVTLSQLSENQTAGAAALKDIVRPERISRSLDTTPPLKNFNVVPEGASPKRTLLNFTPGGPDSADAAMFRKVAKAQQDHLDKLFPSTKTAPAPQLNLFAAGVKSKLLASVDPERTIATRVLASLSLVAGAKKPDDPLDPIMDAPSFPQPMYEALRDLSQDFLLPGLDDVPADTVALLETNSTFVEAFMVGLNAEMSSELLWRDYPTDQRGTYFRQFWDTSAGDAQLDLQPIPQWGNNQLGENTPNTRGKLVLLIRGELLRRYPNTVLYAVRAVKTSGQLDVSRKPEDERPPIFRGTLKPDVTFVGFNLSQDEALGKPPNDPNGWYFVIQQQPTEPRFGLDVADFTTPQPPPLKTWSDLNWRHFANTEDELKALSYASSSKALPEIDHVSWGKNGANQAFITLQRPVRIAIHARQMIVKSVS